MAEALHANPWHGRFAWGADGHGQRAALAERWDRLALAVSAAEAQPAVWQPRFRSLLEDHRFLPGRQLLHAAGAAPGAGQAAGLSGGLAGCLAGCLAIAPLADSLQGVFDALQDSALALHAGADLGVDFSNVLPSQWAGFAEAAAFIGPGPFANLWAVARGLLGKGNGHVGTVAMSLRCDHPDIESFVEALPARGPDPQIQAAVVITDAFMQAVQAGADWPLLFPLHGRALPTGAEVYARIWPGNALPQPCLVHGHVKAQSLWVRLLQAQRSYAAPRLLFEDSMQRGNSLWYGEQLYTANPGASVPLSAHAGCLLGHINLTRLVDHAGTAHAHVHWDELRAVAALAVRFLDDAHDLAAWPGKHFARKAQATRRLGLGITGLASLFGLLGLPYGSASSLDLAEQIMRVVRDAAYQMSAELAQERGAFPAFDATRHAGSAVLLDLPRALQDRIAQHGLRNSHLLALGPDSVLEQLAGPLSHGIEPLCGPGCPEPAPEPQLALAARLQACVDNAVSVTLQVPKSTPAIAFDTLLRQAWSLRLKNCLVQRLA